MGTGRHAYEAAFVGSEVHDHAGQRVRTWKLESRTGPYDADEEFDISADSGLVEHRHIDLMAEWVGGKAALLRSASENECRKSGLVPK